MRRFALVLLLAACTKHNPSASCVDGMCSDPNFPFCDTDGVIGGEPNACIAVTCNPGDFGACDGSDVLTCNAQGNGFDQSACDTGCSADTNGCNGCTPNKVECVGPKLQTCGADGKVASTELCALSCVDGAAPHCAYISPKYLPDICDQVATADALDITSSGMLDTDAQPTCNGGVVAQSTGPSICVLRYKTITIETGATLAFLDSASEANAAGNVAALVADGDLEVHGTLDFGARGIISGPGGGSFLTGGGAGLGLGGGGAGFHTAGASGANTTADGGAQNGGSAQMDPSLLAVVVGAPSTGDGGGGGAALLISCRGAVTIDGTITSGGGGGGGGRTTPNGKTIGGGGGGAGGYVVIEGLQIHVTGGVFANGGGGGAGKGTADGEPGRDGSATSTPALGGASVSGEGAGGRGAALDGGPSAGTHPTSGTPGGGGGGLGFFQSYTPTGVTPELNPSVASPAFQPNGIVPTR